ncbi:MAG: hypothetical protein ACTSYI_15505 [Promethearchaeota archaeon]
MEIKILGEYDHFLENLATLERYPIIFLKSPQLLTKFQSKQMKNQLQNIFDPESGGTLRREASKVHSFYLLDTKGQEIFQTQFGSDPQWQSDSLFNNIFQIDFIKRIGQFMHNSIEINRYNDFKLMFIKSDRFIGCLVYDGPSSILTRKMEKVRDLLSNISYRSSDLLQLGPYLKRIFSTLSAS